MSRLVRRKRDASRPERDDASGASQRGVLGPILGLIFFDPDLSNEINIKEGNNGGWGGIRTHDTLLTYTHFPGARLRPLGHPSLKSPALEPSCGIPRCISFSPCFNRMSRPALLDTKSCDLRLNWGIPRRGRDMIQHGEDTRPAMPRTVTLH